MDKLVKADVKEVEIIYKKGQKSTASFRLTNLMHTMPVAVFLTTTDPSNYSFPNTFSIIPPLSSKSITIFLLNPNPNPNPPLSSPADLVSVKSAILPTGKAQIEELKKIFSRPGPHIFRDAKLPIFLVGPHVAEYIISNYIEVPDAGFHFDKSVSAGCSGSQLTSLLVPAVLSGNPGFVNSLIDRGGDVNCKDLDGRSLISLAVRVGNVAILRLLIGFGCGIKGNGDDLLLHEAAGMNRVDLLDLLCCNFKKLDVNSVDSFGRTPIHVAARNGHVEAIRFCASVGGKVDLCDLDGWTPIHIAAEGGNLEVVECLLELSRGFSKYAVNKEKKTAFELCVENGHSNLYGTLRLGDALHRAARLGDVSGIRSCVADGADVNGRDQNGWTALHRAAFKGMVECVKVLLGCGARVDLVDDAGYTPLHCAVEAGHAEVALLLIAHGARANVKSLKSVGGVGLLGKLDCLKTNPRSFVKQMCQGKEQA